MEKIMFPRLIHIYGPMWVQGYGTMLAIGFLVYIFLTLRHPIRKANVSKEIYLNALFIGLLSGVIGGRLIYVLTSLSEFKGRWIEIFYPWVGGLGILGSIIAVLIAIPFYLHKHHVKALPIFDVAALYAPVFHGIARFGCLLAGCCYGMPAPAQAWWSITFTNPDGIAPICRPLHPTQIYTVIAMVIIFLILQLLSRKLLAKPGLMLCTYLMFENFERFSLDFLRGDQHFVHISWLDSSIILSDMQWVSLVGFILATGGFILLQLLYKEKNNVSHT